MNEAIKLAIEKGGYEDLATEKWQYTEDILFSEFGNFRMTKEEIVLDPLLWQALGKALGWPDEKDACLICNANAKHKIPHGKLQSSWLYYALRFFELKLNGDDEETFWKELLK